MLPNGQGLENLLFVRLHAAQVLRFVVFRYKRCARSRLQNVLASQCLVIQLFGKDLIPKRVKWRPTGVAFQSFPQALLAR